MNIEVMNPDDVYLYISHHIENKIPFSLVRINDGEMIILSKDAIDIKLYKKYNDTQLGYVMTEAMATEVVHNMEQTILNSNIIGINNNETHSYFLRPDESLFTNQIEFIHNIFKKENRSTENLKYCSMLVHMHLLESQLIYKIISGLEDIVLISPRNVADALKARFKNLKTVEYYPVKGEHRFEPPTIKKKYTLEMYNDIVKKIYESNRKGKVCLYGAGFIGKGFGYHFKNAGGIALDVGSVFDLWVGKRTRGTGKGPNATIPDHIL